MRILLILFLTLTAISCNNTGNKSYKDANLPVEERVADLLSKMTLEEKVAQLTSTMPMLGFGSDAETSFVDKDGKFNPEGAAKFFKNGIGQISRPGMRLGPKEMAEFTNTVQKWIIENTRLGIPVMFHEEALHGLATTKATSFPQAIALASTWNPDLVNEVFTATALEVRSRGAQQVLSPVLDIVRDPRWGRTEETYGEDPYLASRMGVAAVTGFQGNSDHIDKAHVIATGKHFAVHGQPENGTNVGPANYSERVIREYFLKPFEAAVKEANLQSIMPSYNEIDGLPSHANIKLLEGVLRKEWGFNGHTVSDYYGIKELMEKHHVAASKEDAARQAIEAGVDMELPYTEMYDSLVDLVKNGVVSEEAVDKCVARVLRSKFITGLFDDPYVDPEYAEEVYKNPEHKALALRAAREAIILLKNEGNILPLSNEKYKKIAVIGPNAKGVHLGNYSGFPEGGVDILQGIKNRITPDQEVLYAEGCKITEADPTAFGFKEPEPGDPEKNAERIKEAVNIAEKADVIILALGGNEFTSREAWIGHLGDRGSLGLLGNQNDLVREMLKLKKPVVVFLMHGRPNAINYIAENIPAILEGWYLGQEGGNAVADALFGNFNPGGKLPLSVPRSVGQLPIFYNYKPTARRGYIDIKKEPLYPFGWGLSYTTFKYDKLSLTSDKIGTQGETKVAVAVTNTGKIKGDEVVQLYLRDEVSSITRPVKELKGFKRISLDPGETKTVEFTLGPEELYLLDRDMRKVVEPGTFKIMVGGNSVDLIETTLETVEAE
ncbi:MAG: glycoside hydrolase family 3 N-terminal domain-containing protein [Desulfobacteraceae bacterium]